MFSRLVGAAPRVTGRRPYSFFSSKPPGGIVKQQQQQQQSQSQQTNAVKRIAAPPSPTPTPAVSTAATSTATTTATTQAAPAPAAEPKPAPVPSPPAPPPIPTLHPSPVLATMHLHSFFALDRPMLLLSQPTSRLFDTGLPPRAQPDVDTTGIESDADADAARALSHALVMSRVRGAVDWKVVLEKLGTDVSSAADVSEEARVGGDLAVLLDSVKRKRRKKITKHKYKKRRKVQFIWPIACMLD
ncbi:hypothetical protein RhiJN_13851 [Ceratobasidium sp. AG-Ba]|nr:hypothetical protein RhiJN_13851 [Ceratobasidium sp. AG-Ba]QRW14410.1 hypothetical protein RhiLY_13409 [Ceratobasidium sp. AG-Ba]